MQSRRIGEPVDKGFEPLLAFIEKEMRKGKKEIKIPDALLSEASEKAIQEAKRLCKLNNVVLLIEAK